MTGSRAVGPALLIATQSFPTDAKVTAGVIAVGLIGMSASTAVGRNPGSSTKVMVQAILAIAFAEAIVFYALFLAH